MKTELQKAMQYLESQLAELKAKVEEIEQAEKQQAQEQEKADEIEHKQQQSNDLVRANGVFNDR
jgi:hypothetical protein